MSDISVRLGGDNSEYRSMLDDSVKQSEFFAGKIATKVSDKLFGLREVAHTVATFLGLNLENIAENLARSFAGLSKEEEEVINKINALMDQTAAKNAESERRRLSAEQQYQSDLRTTTDMLAKIAQLNADIAKNEQVYADVFNQTQDAFAASQEQRKADLDTANKRLEIEEATKTLTEASNRVKDAGHANDLAYEKAIGATQDDNAKAAEEIDAQMQKARDEARKKEEAEDARKLAVHNATVVQQAQDIAAETAKLVILQKQTAEMENQVARKQQLDALEEAALNQSISGDIQFRSREQLAGASDAVLQELIKRDKAKADALLNPANPNYRPLTDIDVATGSLQRKLDASGFSIEASLAQQELSGRQSLRSVDYATALKTYSGDPLTFDQQYSSAMRTQNDLIAQNTAALNTLSAQLHPVFPKPAG